MAPLPARRYHPETALLVAAEKKQADLTAALVGLDARLEEFAALPVGWDSYQGAPLTQPARALVNRLIGELVDDAVKAPQLVPLPDGGVQLEWHAAGYDIEISVNGDETVEAYVEEPSGESHEGRLSRRMRQLIAAALDAITTSTGPYSVWCMTTNNLLAEVPTAEQAIAVVKCDPASLVAFAPAKPGETAAVIFDERHLTRQQPIRYESEVVMMADGEHSVVMHELPQLFRRSVLEQAIDALEHADLELELLIDASEQGGPRPAQLKHARRVRRHKLQRAIRELRVEAGWDERAGR